jgi:ABC-type oligopeptide transport system ATPase subunit
MKKIIKLRNLSVQYKKGISTITALNQVNLDIFEGEKLGVVGESGSGKSTLAKGVMRLEHSLGQIYFEDKLINNEPLNVAKMYKSYFKQLEKTKFLYAEFLKHLGK